MSELDIPELEYRDLGLLEWASRRPHVQEQLVAERKQGLIPDRLLFVEHPHVITMGRNAHAENLLVDKETLRRAEIGLHETNRGGDVTYHGPGQVVGYPILDLNEWKRDVHLYVRSVEQAIIDTLADFGIPGNAWPV